MINNYFYINQGLHQNSNSISGEDQMKSIDNTANLNSNYSVTQNRRQKMVSSSQRYQTLPSKIVTEMNESVEKPQNKSRESNSNSALKRNPMTATHKSMSLEKKYGVIPKSI
mmetsp:Transcript_3258/g.2811  ORF Transcript_3258/g.2811 Transcript_3258/m.2811 type:complete len:112 (-) Transcript_3258:520-855(-)